MRLIKGILRPIYQAFFEKPLWWFLSRVKAFFMAEILEQDIGGRLAGIERRLNATESNNAAQWSALEQLLLAVYRQPDTRSARDETDGENVPSGAAEQDGINERHGVR